MIDHYFATKLTDTQGNPIPTQQFRTLQGAMAYVYEFDRPSGSIWYYGDASMPPPALCAGTHILRSPENQPADQAVSARTALAQSTLR
jgi:hypothetical protein